MAPCAEVAMKDDTSTMPASRPRTSRFLQRARASVNPRLRRRGALAAVGVLEPDDVVELRRRNLEDRRVVDRRHAMDRARPEAERRTRCDHLLLQRLLARRAELELGAPRLDEPRLVLF